MTRPLSLGVVLLSCVPSAFAQGVSSAQYEVRFDATWSAATHPGAYPNNAHFSPLIGGTHSSAVRFWEPGALASPGIEVMAETGNPGPLANEVSTAINFGTAALLLQGGAPNSPGSTSFLFTIDENLPLVTLVTMVAPSPDWFVGVDSLSLLENGVWVDRVVDLVAWDAGTDSGANFTSPNQASNPPEPIALITGGPFTGNDPLGTFTFLRVPLGSNYCGPAVPNSTGQPGTLLATGSGFAGFPLTLTAEALSPNQFGYFLVSAQQGSATPPFSAGVLCLAGNIGRFTGPGQVAQSDPAGRLNLLIDTSALPLNPTVSAQSGETWNFQAWYRDSVMVSNFSNGLELTFS